MGKVIKVRFRRHARASARSREAKPARASAVSPAFCAVSVFRIWTHHSAGMLSRCGHLRTAATPAPISDASASGESHNPTTSLKDEGMDGNLGQSVLNSKANVSFDYANLPVLQSCMLGDQAKTVFKQEFTKRVALARVGRNYTQAQLADKLGMEQDKYKQYERRSLLPHDLIPRFCELCDIDTAWLFTGRGLAPRLEVERPAPKKRKNKSRAA